MKTVLTDENYDALAAYRWDRALETLSEIPYLREQGYYNTAVNRLYYACYYAAVALLVQNRILAGTHLGVKTMIGMHFVSKGLITRESGRAFTNLYESRQRGDYDEFVYATKEEVDDLLPRARKFVDEVGFLLSKGRILK